MTTLKTIAPAEVAEQMKNGAVLIDVREADEHARERIAGARLHPLSRLDGPPLSAPGVVIFHCRSGGRTGANAARLAAAVPGCETYVLEGGIEGWKAAGLPVAQDRSQPIEIVRQVQIAAGSFILIGVILGFAVSSAFFGVAAFVGVGLVFTGASGSCLMAKLLAVMPWNKPIRA